MQRAAGTSHTGDTSVVKWWSAQAYCACHAVFCYQVTKAHRTYGRNGIILPSRKGGRVGVKSGSNRCFEGFVFNAQGSELSVFCGEFP